jgi:hypothetical protein
MTIDMMAPIVGGLAESRQVIAFEQQGHGAVELFKLLGGGVMGDLAGMPFRAKAMKLSDEFCPRWSS